MKHEAALFDADGVLTLPEEFFSRIYARGHGLPEDNFHSFFVGEEFRMASVGKADLKDLIKKHKDLWMVDDPDILLDEWFETENVRNEELLSLIKQLRNLGLMCFVASTQEKYRGQYFKDVMFKGEFDGFYISADIGHKKPEREFFESIIDDLTAREIVTHPANIFFTDDGVENIEQAREVEIDAHLYQSPEQIREPLS